MSIQTNNDLPDNRSSLPGSILEHIADAVVYADETGTIRRWEPCRHRAVRLRARGWMLVACYPTEQVSRPWAGEPPVLSIALREVRSPLICLSNNRPSSRS